MENNQKIEELRRANAGLMEGIVRQEVELQELVRRLREEYQEDSERERDGGRGNQSTPASQM